ncbi:MAG: MucB/RseB C-terminal domain-containing protein [Elusimicrobia bacterium]|nr:MucB/RseB C-terminal domain-containing protein [Elusimicrobiota bacterium]
MNLTRWRSADTHSEEADVYFMPPRSYRIEFLSPSGAVDRVVLTDGSRQEIQLVRQGKLVESDEKSFGSPLLSDERQRSLLLVNYTVEVAGTDKVLARPVWIVQLTPLYPGKPAERLLVDQESGIILEARRVAAEAGSSTTFTRFEPNVKLPESLFAWSHPAPNVDEALAKPNDRESAGSWPSTLPGGFSLLSSENFEINGKPVRHLRYFDGLSSFSIFETAAPVADAPVKPAIDALRPGPVVEAVERWKAHGRYLTAIGEIPAPLFAAIQQQIR